MITHTLKQMKNQFCTGCGKKNVNEWNYCPDCGTNLTSSSHSFYPSIGTFIPYAGGALEYGMDIANCGALQDSTSTSQDIARRSGLS